MVSPKQKVGYKAEEKACAFLQSKGLILVEKNFSCERGEIDLIMKENDYIVFVEVRSRNSNYTEALESISQAKQHRVIRAATIFLLHKNWFNKIDCRFDVIAMDETETHWIKNAFNVETSA